MSFEGYYEVLCENGHLSKFDVYDTYTRDSCYHCSKEFVWWNIVDTTNSIYPEDNDATEFEVLSEEKTETCSCCGHTKVVEPTRYKIPEGRGRLGKFVGDIWENLFD